MDIEAEKPKLDAFAITDVRSWTSDLKDRHIRSNVVSSGPAETPVIDGHPAGLIARIVSTIPMGRMGVADEIAKAAFFRFG
jgi:NAD(P)-dependent dehydrogenase (short-subunit alcohol dehydrogenase family)